MKFLKIVTLAIMAVILSGIDDKDTSVTAAFKGFGRLLFSMIVAGIGIAAYRAADKEQKRWES
ncbi:hypothetical protein ES708_05017 [subsurface metagenome]